MIVQHLDNLPDIGKIVKIKVRLLFSKTVKKYICPLGHKNDRDVECCETGSSVWKPQKEAPRLHPDEKSLPLWRWRTCSSYHVSRYTEWPAGETYHATEMARTSCSTEMRFWNGSPPEGLKIIDKNKAGL